MNHMQNVWGYLALLFAGVIIGLIVYLKIDGPETVINDNTQIGKMKQRGKGNQATVTVDPKNAMEETIQVKSREEKREARKVNRIAGRRERRDERKEERESGSL
jgi:hypothetical protein